MTAARFSFPSSSAGYWRGTGIQGLGAENWREMGTGAQGIGMQSQGTGSFTVAGQAWHPTVIYLLILILVEMFVFGFIGRILR
jgi:hypothetical protein